MLENMFMQGNLGSVWLLKFRRRENLICYGNPCVCKIMCYKMNSLLNGFLLVVRATFSE